MFPKPSARPRQYSRRAIRLRLWFGALAASFTLGLPTAAAAAPDAVCFYTRTDYRGEERCYPRGEYNRMPRGMPFRVHSMKILTRSQITLCTRFNLAGRCKTYRTSQPRMSGSTFERYKSMQIERRVALRRPNQDQTCLYSERNFNGTASCYRSNRIHYIARTGAVRSIIPARRSYVYLCSQTSYRGICREVVQRTGKRFVVPRIRNGSLVIVPDNRIIRLIDGIGLRMVRNSYWDLDSDQLISRRGAPGADLALVASEQGPILRILNSARLFLNIKQSGRQVASCVAQAAAGDRNARTYVLLSQLDEDQSLCVKTALGSWAILKVSDIDLGNARLRTVMDVARLR